jgi:HPt (histidine-containing phosphotransfer) domain-containing protein
LIRAVHSLKGSAQSAGAAALAALASAAEARLKKEGGTDLPERQALVDALAAYETAVTIKRFAAAA